MEWASIQIITFNNNFSQFDVLEKNGSRRYTFNSCTINNSNFFEATVIIIVWNRLNGIERNKYFFLWKSTVDKQKKTLTFCFIEWKNIDFNVNFIRLENVIKSVFGYQINEEKKNSRLKILSFFGIRVSLLLISIIFIFNTVFFHPVLLLNPIDR